LSLSVAESSDSTTLQKEIDDYYAYCDECSNRLDDAIKDLKFCEASKNANLDWYQTDLGLLAVGVLTFGLGYYVGSGLK
jgi:hypothetical protein